MGMNVIVLGLIVEGDQVAATGSASSDGIGPRHRIGELEIMMTGKNDSAGRIVGSRFPRGIRSLHFSFKSIDTGFGIGGAGAVAA